MKKISVDLRKNKFSAIEPILKKKIVVPPNPKPRLVKNYSSMINPPKQDTKRSYSSVQITKPAPIDYDKLIQKAYEVYTQCYNDLTSLQRTYSLAIA